MGAVSRILASPTQMGILAGSVVFVGGFGMMLTFWLTSDYTGERGFPFYLSATLGDALILPIIAFLGTRLVTENGSTPKERRAAHVASAVGGAAGAATQLSWLRSDDINLNWTFAAMHHFNAAGWYHAVFLTGAAGFFVGLTSLMLLQYRRLQTIPERQNHDYLAILFLIAMFAALLATDNHRAEGHFDLRVAILPITVSLIVALPIRLVAGRRYTRLWIATSIVFVMVSAETALLLGQRREYTTMSVTLGAACFVAGTGVLSSTRRTALSEQIYRSLPIGVAVAVPIFYAPADIRGGLLSIGIAILLGSATQTQILGYQGLLRSLNLTESVAPIGCLIAVGSMSIIAFETQRTEYNDLLSYVVLFALLAFVSGAINRSFKPMIQAEEEDDPQVQAEKSTAYKRSITLAALTFVTILMSLVATAPGAGSTDGDGLAWQSLSMIAGLIATLSVLLILIGSMGLRSLILLSCVPAFVYLGLPGSPPNSFVGWIQFWLVIAGTIFAALFTCEGMRANAYHLHDRAVSRSDKTSIGAIGLFAGSLTFAVLASLSSVRSLAEDWFPVLILTLVYAAGTIAVPTANIWTTGWAKRQSRFVKPTPLAGVAQDQGSVVLLVVFGVAVPIVLGAGRSFLELLGPILGYLTLVATAFVYVMQNNQRHVASEARKCREKAATESQQDNRERKQYVRRLVIHCNRQNMLASIALAAPTALPAFLALVGTLTGMHTKEHARDVFRLFVVRDGLSDTDPRQDH